MRRVGLPSSLSLSLTASLPHCAATPFLKPSQFAIYPLICTWLLSQLDTRAGSQSAVATLPPASWPARLPDNPLRPMPSRQASFSWTPRGSAQPSPAQSSQRCKAEPASQPASHLSIGRAASVEAASSALSLAASLADLEAHGTIGYDSPDGSSVWQIRVAPARERAEEIPR